MVWLSSEWTTAGPSDPAPFLPPLPMHLHIVPNNLTGISYLLNHECRSLIREMLCTSCPVRFNVGHGHPLPAVTTQFKLSIIHRALSFAISSRVQGILFVAMKSFSLLFPIP
ncbi:hypothetical protein FOIG_05018 [Fusarium odoratissimum NRRL 54006]|uniref:Uncharacterized protein n=1 Tax=Fusarium odoratissimum (strain NRRL 54006) TaxID=1089451 RepID=X0JUC6_FUSO5|nr:uncharacterized protein FOIG_05018 [Fusarium odoratissimum NRRL 54006]XP_031066968.1 uncharacterized protein FOIG_05018 [Fusarium odoratissimum NRRL 54006]EXM04878.1 hypothetical protein FOIG_05018 [Fusarium odoratissimum NRRL 54006]EXM04879.1 hypothetical protein FOIG_05018 [Fusarium odoratissimum NRRL 54006]